MEIRPIPDSVRSALRLGSNLLTIPHSINELIYNAIDAETKCIEIRVDLTNFQFQVIDDGYGITKSNLNLIGTRYMSSKCNNLIDYTNISKFYGFRGETLCSLISVCQSVIIQTRSKICDETYRKCFFNGLNSKNIENDSISRPSHGTTVIVNGWMKNLPVRQKLVSPIFDMVEIKNQIEKIALVNPNISFSLRNNSNKKILLSIRRSNTLLKSINLIFGSDIATNLKHVNFEHRNLKITGYISDKAIPKCDAQLIYLNRRIIKKSRIHKYLRGVFSNCDLLSENPVYFLYFECPYAEFEMFYKENSIKIEFKHPDKILNYTNKILIKFLTDENLMNKIDKKSSNSIRESENFSRIGITQFDTILKSKIATKSSETLNKITSYPEIEQGGEQLNEKIYNLEKLRMNNQSQILVHKKNFNYQQQYVENLNHTISQKSEEKGRTTDDHVFKTPTVPPLRKSVVKKTSTLQTNSDKLITQSTMKTYDSHAKNFQNKVKSKRIIPVYTKIENTSKDMTPKTKVCTWLNNLEQNNDDISIKDSEKNLVQIKSKRIMKRRKSIDSCEKENADDSLDLQMQSDLINEENYNSRFTENAGNTSKEDATLKTKLSGDISIKDSEKNLVQTKSKRIMKRLRSIHPCEKENAEDSLDLQMQVDLINDENYNYRLTEKTGNTSKEDVISKIKLCTRLINLEENNDNNSIKDSEKNLVQTNSKRIMKRRRSFMIDSCEKENTQDSLDLETQGDKVFNDKTKLNANHSNIHSKNEFKAMEKSLNNQENNFKIPFRLNFDQIERNSTIKFHSIDDNSEIEIITPKPLKSHCEADNNSFENHNRNNVRVIDLTTPINCNQLVKTKKMEEKSEWHFNFTPYPTKVPKLFDSFSDNSFKFVMPQSILKESFAETTSVAIASKHTSHHYQEGPTETPIQENNKNSSFILNNYFDRYVQAHRKSVLENPIQDDIASDVNEIEFEKGLNNIITSTAKTSSSKKESEPKFQLVKRLDVIPKGMSQIYDDPNKCICRYLSPRTRNELLKKIKRKYEQKLNFDHDLESYGRIFDKRFGGIRQQIQISMTKKSKISRTYSFPKSIFNKLKTLNQIDKKFIATFLEPTFSENGILILFDQHAVHERIRLEKLLKDYEKLPGISKASKLDDILKFNLDSTKREIMKNYRVNFENHGFIYTITNDSVNIMSIPTCIFNKSCREKTSNRNNLMSVLTITLINELIEFCLDTNGVTNFFPNTVLTIINSEACRGATKFGDELSLDKCKLYIQQLSKCSLPFQCAHGRPTLVPIFEFKSIKNNFENVKINFQNIRKKK